MTPTPAYEIPPGHDAWGRGRRAVRHGRLRGLPWNHRPPASRILATILFTDVVDSTSSAERMGDHGWRKMVADHDDRVRYHLAHPFGGRGRVDDIGEEDRRKDPLAGGLGRDEEPAHACEVVR